MLLDRIADVRTQGQKGIRMGTLDGRVAVITGAGRGLGREHALLFAREGARVVVNDRGGSADGSGSDAGPAQEVVAEIVALGGQAVSSGHDVADSTDARELINLAVDTFGACDVLVNNAGILRDRSIVNMSEPEWDDVIRVHLRGHVMPLQQAGRYWRERSKAGDRVAASVINTSSTSGLFGLAGQSNYGAAKMGIAAMTIIADMEMRKYGVRVNAIAPAARTRLTENIPGSAARQAVAQKSIAETGWDPRDPANVSPFVAYLATESCRISGRVFFLRGGQVSLLRPFSTAETISKHGRWEVAELAAKADFMADYDLGVVNPGSLP
jgi:NAD(P)-dependent dehydrogenase (short-subunit alcohol dehydrogenase family)